MGRDNEDRFITATSTPAAAEWDGWGTALKPAWEPIIVARKPLQGTVAENVQRYGTGAMNVDACRIETDEQIAAHHGTNGANGHTMGARNEYIKGSGGTIFQTAGRWPANLIHDGSAEVLAGFPQSEVSGAAMNGRKAQSNIFRTGATSFDAVKGNGTLHGDTGSAARFFYCAKASKQDRDEGCEGLEVKGNTFANGTRRRCAEHDAGVQSGGNTYACGCPISYDEPRDSTQSHNHHPTVKPTALMRYLCRLVTPPNGTILDPFMGSGSTGKAAILEGFNFIGVDTEIEYVEIAARRIEHACEKVGIVIEHPMMFETKRETVDRPKQLILL